MGIIQTVIDLFDFSGLEETEFWFFIFKLLIRENSE